jgi:ribose 5-phosphate isomerase A
MMDAKKQAAEKAVSFIQEGMLIGLGTGSTAYWAIQALGEKVKGGMHITAVASSVATEELAKQCGITLVDFTQHTQIDLSIDGADEVDAQHNLIKGGGGALLREKIIAYNSKSFLVIVSETKLVHYLGKFPLPVEIVPFGAALTIKNLQALGCTTQLRQKEGKDFITDNGNLVVDCAFETIKEPEILDAKIRSIPGVVVSGLFDHNKVSQVIVGRENGSVSLLIPEGFGC